MADLKGVEIFATGTWRGNKKITITASDLDAMIASFTALGGQVDGFRPPLVIGHTRTPGEMAYGWTQRIYRVGDKILADFSDVPDYLLYSIEEKRYNSVSIEMYPSIDYAGKTFQNVLSAVAVLGAELPAVKGLKPLSASIFSDAGPAEQLSKEEMMFTQEQVDALIAAAVAKATAQFKDSNEADTEKFAADLSTANDTIKSVTEAKERAEVALSVFKAEASDRELDAFIETAIKEGKVLPKQKAALVAMAKSMSGVIKFGDKDQSPIDVIKSFISEAPVKVDFSEKGSSHADTGKRADLEVDRRAKAAQATAGGATKLSYQDAVNKVLAEDNTLKLAYFSEA